MKKKPKVKETVTADKTPKTQEIPRSYKEHYASWQLSHIDFGGDWGLSSLRGANRFSLSDDLLELSNLDNDIFDFISNQDGKTFKSSIELLEKIHAHKEISLTTQQLKSILQLIEENVFWKEIFPKLSHFESKTWIEIEKEQYGKEGKTKHHFIRVDSIGDDAKKRLAELHLDDIDELFSIRLTGKIRIWGLRKLGYFQVLWVDLYHKVYPV